MSEYLGTIKLFAGDFAPHNWAFCDGRMLNIGKNYYLFNIIGFLYGGSGDEFALPDLRGRTVIGVNMKADGDKNKLIAGAKGGQEQITLTHDNLPEHSHTLKAGNIDADEESPKGTVFAKTKGTIEWDKRESKMAPVISTSYQSDVQNLKPMVPGTISMEGAGLAHNNIQPYLGSNYIICIEGIYIAPGSAEVMDGTIGEIIPFAGNKAPVGWAFCEGQEVAISLNEGLFSIVGTKYGGDGRVTFGLPDLRLRVPIGLRDEPDQSKFYLGQQGGTATVNLSEEQMPRHKHDIHANDSKGDDYKAGSHFIAQSIGHQKTDIDNTYVNNTYLKNDPDVNMAAESLSKTGSNTPHDNLQPYLACHYIICMAGLYPNRT